MSENKSREELDDFWKIDKLIPEKKVRPPFSEHTYDTEAVEVIVTAKESTSYDKLNTIEMRPSDQGVGKLTFPPQITEKKSTPDVEYSPDNPFIKNVKIFRQTNFSYYEAFFEDGMKNLGTEGTECQEVPYFSYVPQYSQLNASQREWYFFMRSELRRGTWVDTSYSYLLLYIFELLNVEPDKEHALIMLCSIWDHYRIKYLKLDPLMPEWITDFCLINRLTPSRELFGESYHVLLERASIKELFICPKTDDAELASALLDLSVNYDYRKSKFATGENLPLYEQYIPMALTAVLRSFNGKKSIFTGSGELKRNAFVGAICTPHNKCRIEVEYCSISRSHEMRFLITDVVKHTENRIRAYIGVKSRLTVYSLPVDVRGIIDVFMDDALGRNRRPQKEEVHEYDKLYELPKVDFSLDSAKRIEENSWQTTQKLVDAFEEDEETSESEIESVKPQDCLENNKTAENAELSPEEALLSALFPYAEFISAAMAKNKEAENRFAAEKGKMISSVAYEINEIAADVFGDIILEENDGVYTVIEDYAEVFKNA